MNKFNLTISNNTTADQITSLLNSGGQLWCHLNRYSILHSPIKYLIELDKDKVIAVIGLEQKNLRVSEMKHLCVHPSYRRQGLGKKMLVLGVKYSETEFVYGTVREDNRTNLRNNLRIGMKPIGKYRGRDCSIIVLARRRDAVNEHR